MHDILIFEDIFLFTVFFLSLAWAITESFVKYVRSLAPCKIDKY